MSTRISRRALLGGIAAASLAAGCGARGGLRGVVRVGCQANLTNAPLLAGLASGRLAAALGATRIETRVFRAGPRVVEALLGRAIDVGMCGPAPVVIAHARHGAGTLSILSGCASGGASFLVTRGSGIRAAQGLHGAKLATPQIGSTQDVALRTYLKNNGLECAERGGDVTVSALASPSILLQMQLGELSGAWLPEPWATRAAEELGAVRLVDERDLWPDRAFPTAILVARGDYVSARPEVIRPLRSALDEEVRRALSTPAELEDRAYDEIRRLVGNAGKRSIFHAAMDRVDFTSDPMPDRVERFARDACALGIIPSVSCAPLFRESSS